MGDCMKENLSEQLMDLVNYPGDRILSKVIVKNDCLNVTLFCMAKGTDMSEHTTTKKACVQVIDGVGVFNLEGKDIKMSAGTFIYMQENAVHSLKASQNMSFLLTLT